MISIGLISCKDTQTNPDQVIVFPSSNVSYTKYIDPLFQQKCAFSPCHGGDVPASGLNLEIPSYHALTTYNPTLVASGDTNCILMQVLEGRLPQMPPPKFPQLNQNQIGGIRTWIIEGAKPN